MRKLIGSCVFCLVLLGTILVAPTPAHASTPILGTFYDGPGYNGASFSVVGNLCSGGFNLPDRWNNKISSILNGCNRIVLYDGYNFTGAGVNCWAPGCTLERHYMDNRASSIRLYS